MDGKQFDGFYLGADELDNSSLNSEENIIDTNSENSEIIDNKNKDDKKIDDEKSDTDSRFAADLKLLGMGGNVKASMAFTDVEQGFSDIESDKYTVISDPMDPEVLNRNIIDKINAKNPNLNNNTEIEEEEIDLANLKIGGEELDDAIIREDGNDNEVITTENLRRAMGPGVKDGIVFSELSPAGKVLYMLTYYPLKDSGFKDLLPLAHEMTTLNLEASKENADPELTKKIAVSGIEFHLKAGEILNKIQKEEPLRFQTNGDVSNLIVAYNMNSNNTVKAIEDAKGDIFPALVENAFDNIVQSAHELYESGGEEKRKAFENNLAKAMYMAKLKAEFDRVNGSEEEQKAWKAEILNELLSDRFAANVEEFKNSEIYKRTLDGLKDAENEPLGDVAIKKIIDEKAIELAEEKYHDVYKYIHLGFQNEADSSDARKKIGEIDEIKALANAIGEKQGEDPELKDFNNHPAFDTMYLKKRINLYGKQENFAGKIRKEKEDEEALAKRIATAKKDFREDFLKKHQQKEDSYRRQGGVFDYFADIEEINRKFDENIKKLKELDKSNLSPDEKNKQQKIIGDQNYGLAIERSQIKEKMYEKYHKDFIARSEEEYQKFLEEKKNLETLAKQAEAEGEKFVLNMVKENKEFEEGTGKRYLGYEIENYAKAVEDKDSNAINKIKQDRYNRDNKFKKENIELYAPVKYNGQDVYVSRSSEESRNNMENTFATYKQKYNVNDPKLDKQYQQSLQKYDENERRYINTATLMKPDRSNQKILAFKVNNQIEIDDIDLNKVVMDVTVNHVRPDQMQANENPVRFNAEQLRGLGFEGASRENLAYGLRIVRDLMRRQTAFLGTEEYTGIVNGLGELADSIDANGFTAENMKKARVLDAKLGLYIDRKRDERDSVRREKNTPKNRRVAAETAKNTLGKVLDEMMKQSGEIQNDHTFEECAAKLEAVINLTNTNNEGLRQVMTNLNQKDYQSSITSMYNYLCANANRYIDRRNGEYTFRLRENEEGGKKRLFPSDNGKVFKEVLLCFEKLENSYLEHLSKTDPIKLPGAIFHAKHTGPDVTKGRSLNRILGIQINTDAYETREMNIQPSDTITKQIQQYENHYKYLMHKSSYKNEDMVINNPDDYNPETALSWAESREMVDSALSVYYLKALETKLAEENKPFNFEEAEEGRRKFISAIRKCSAYEKMAEECTKYFDCSQEELEDLHSENTSYRNLIKNTEEFKKQVVIRQLGKEIATEVDVVSTLLCDTEQMKKARINNNMDDMVYNLKVAKLLGISDEVENEAQLDIHNMKFKGTYFKDTLKHVSDEFKKTSVKREEKVTKGVEPKML